MVQYERPTWRCTTDVAWHDRDSRQLFDRYDRYDRYAPLRPCYDRYCRRPQGGEEIFGPWVQIYPCSTTNRSQIYP